MTAKTPLLATCSRCGRRVLDVRADYQNNYLLGEPRLDPVALDHQQVTACILTGLSLWQVHMHAGRHVTSRRTRYWPRLPVAGHIVPEHACSRVWDAFPIDITPAHIVIPDTCPF